MRKLPFAIVIITLFVPLPYLSGANTTFSSDPTPFAPHEVNVLVVSPTNIFNKGGGYLIADLARYGFNITQQTSDDALATDYLTDPKTSDLSRYDAVILHGGFFGSPPTLMTMQELNHFTGFDGVLVIIGNACFANETSGTWWDGNLFTSVAIQNLERRLGVNYVDYLREPQIAPNYHNNGTFTLVDSSIQGLPSSLSYITANPDSVNYQFEATADPARKVYDFTAEGGKTTAGVTYYENATGAVGIYIQGSYIYATEPELGQISYFGLTDMGNRPRLIASLIAYALRVDINTILKPQPLATLVLDKLGSWGWDESYLYPSLSNFNSIVDACNITPTIAFNDYPYFNSLYWQEVAPNILSQLKGVYRDWEYSSDLRNANLTSMTQTQVESLIENVKAEFSSLRMDPFSTIVTLSGHLNQATLDAMKSKELYLLGAPSTVYSDWWNLRINSSVLVNSEVRMADEFAENFAQMSRDSLHSTYFSKRDGFALAVVDGTPSFVYDVANFRWNEVGTYSLRTVCENLTSEIPDIRFTPLIESGLYFGNKWIHIENAARVQSVIDFDLDASAIPDVANIGKGMLWLRIGTSERIQNVSIDGKAWFYFDDHSIRLPTPESVAHLEVTLGNQSNPTIIRTAYKAVGTIWDGYRFVVSISAKPGCNVTASLFIPNSGPFYDAPPQWNVFCSVDTSKWNYRFDVVSRILEFWAISDGLITFQVGPDVVPPVIWLVENTTPLYNQSVRVFANITDLGTGMGTVSLSYSHRFINWTSLLMNFEDGLYVATIEPLPYGTLVSYRLNASDNIENWKETQTYTYNVTDKTPPEFKVIEWTPTSPSPNEPVTLNVTIREPMLASGVNKATVWFFTDQNVLSIQEMPMTFEDGFWKAVIPGQDGGTLVSFKIDAFDKAQNYRESDDYTYRIQDQERTNLPLPLIIACTITIVVLAGTAIYLLKFRRTRKARAHS